MHHYLHIVVSQAMLAQVLPLNLQLLLIIAHYSSEALKSCAREFLRWLYIYLNVLVSQCPLR